MAKTEESEYRLPAIEQARVAKLKSADAQAALASSLKWERIALNQLVQSQRPGEVILEKTDAGVPILVGHTDVSVSISRSEGAAMVAVSEEGRVGVDVERIRPIAFEAMLAMVATDAEQACILALKDRIGFFRMWTIKESVLKAMGTGLAGDAKSIDVPATLIVADGQGVVMTDAGTCETLVWCEDGVVAAATLLR